jgi:hypothetical protein
MWTARMPEAEWRQVLQGSMSMGGKRRWVSSGHIWAAGFHHVMACSHSVGISKLTNYFFNFPILGGGGGPRWTTDNWNHAYWIGEYMGMPVYTHTNTHTHTHTHTHSLIWNGKAFIFQFNMFLDQQPACYFEYFPKQTRNLSHKWIQHYMCLRTKPWSCVGGMEWCLKCTGLQHLRNSVLRFMAHLLYSCSFWTMVTTNILLFPTVSNSTLVDSKSFG